MLSSMTTINKARELWLSPHADMAEVERLYRSILLNDDSESAPNDQMLITNDGGNGSKATSSDSETNVQVLAHEKLALLLCQSGRSDEASSILSSLGYTCRLSSIVLDYPSLETAVANPSASIPSVIHNPKTARPCQVMDSFLTPRELKALQDVFLDPQANYWMDHNYQVEPPSPYFSYLVPLNKTCNQQNEFGFLGHVVQKVYQQMLPFFPTLTKTTCVEMWAHNRPHASGHQFHFDSDNEGFGGVRNPIISTILYITGGNDDASSVGGPSLVTNQKLIHQQLASKGWISHAKEKRLVAFDGRVLHGVIPGKGSGTDGRRVTLMFAFWKKIKVRTEGTAARAFPTELPVDGWASRLRRTIKLDEEQSSPTLVEPMEIKPIYETLDGVAWTRDMGFPEYDKVYQGF